ncbi:MAG: choice-of-anchor X domain-containing protein [bacterium]
MIASILFYSCEENNDQVIDPTYSSPLISNPYKSKDTIFTTSTSPLINFITSISVNVNDGSPIKSVISTVIDPNGDIVGQFNMFDNGTSGDTTAGDNKYTTVINISNIECLLVGGYTIQYIAENNSGLFSNLIISGLDVVNTANLPPVITSTNLPDSVTRPSPGDSTLLTISINVTDPDGLCDLRDASFVTVRPNGIMLPPIPMFNNGNGQFIFAAYVGYSADPTSYGYFKYTFTARDRSGIFSNPVKDSIKFVQQ